MGMRRPQKGVALVVVLALVMVLMLVTVVPLRMAFTRALMAQAVSDHELAERAAERGLAHCERALVDGAHRLEAPSVTGSGVAPWDGLLWTQAASWGPGGVRRDLRHEIDFEPASVSVACVTECLHLAGGGGARVPPPARADCQADDEVLVVTVHAFTRPSRQGVPDGVMETQGGVWWQSVSRLHGGRVVDRVARPLLGPNQ